MRDLYNEAELKGFKESIEGLINEKFDWTDILKFHQEGELGSVLEENDAIVHCKLFKDAGVKASFLANNPIKNMTLAELKNCEYSIKDLKDAFNTSLKEFRKAGYDVLELTKDKDFTVSQLLQERFDVSQVYEKCLFQNQNGVSKEKQLLDAGLSIHDLRYYLEHNII